MAETLNLHESHLRSLLKALSWRVIATATTAAIAYFITGEIGVAVAIGGIEFFLKLIVYYFHERTWQLVPLGTIRTIYRWKHGSKQTEKA